MRNESQGGSASGSRRCLMDKEVALLAKMEEDSMEAERWGGRGRPFCSGNICVSRGAEPGELTLGSAESRAALGGECTETSLEKLTSVKTTNTEFKEACLADLHLCFSPEMLGPTACWLPGSDSGWTTLISFDIREHEIYHPWRTNGALGFTDMK